MTHGLWGHALFLASKMDERSYSRVMLRFANGLDVNDPLQTLYQLMSGRLPIAVKVNFFFTYFWPRASPKFLKDTMLSVVLFDIMIFFVISSCLYNLLYVLSSILTYFIIFGHLWTYCVIYFEKNGSHLKKFEIFWCARSWSDTNWNSLVFLCP